jgi:hypothetical protein
VLAVTGIISNSLRALMTGLRQAALPASRLRKALRNDDIRITEAIDKASLLPKAARRLKPTLKAVATKDR